MEFKDYYGILGVAADAETAEEAIERQFQTLIEDRAEWRDEAEPLELENPGQASVAQGLCRPAPGYSSVNQSVLGAIC